MNESIPYFPTKLDTATSLLMVLETLQHAIDYVDENDGKENNSYDILNQARYRAIHQASRNIQSVTWNINGKGGR